MSRRSLQKKKRLAKATRKNKRIPAFVIARTKRKVSNNRYRRDWRTDKLRIAEED